ncbi:MAG: hypothetical protein IPJ50_22935 [Betaproteobacteria bacterium]|nr:hypothetical protein [Betaproteobacteria bacterium]
MALEEIRSPPDGSLMLRQKCKSRLAKKRGGGSEGNVTANVGGVMLARPWPQFPADIAVDPDFRVRIARVLGLLVSRNSVLMYSVLAE